MPNAAPDFGADSATREVAENSPAGTNVGAAVTATDDDNDTLTYSLEGHRRRLVRHRLHQRPDPDHVGGDLRLRDDVELFFSDGQGRRRSNDGTDTIAVAIDLLDVDEAPDDGRRRSPTIADPITSDPGADETYAIGDTVAVTVTFDQAVTVTGTPRITLRIGGGALSTEVGGPTPTWRVAKLRCASPTRSRKTTRTTDGIYLEADELELNNGTITGVNGGLDATLTYARPGQQDDHKVDGVRPTPTGAVIPVDGDTITLTFNEPLSATTASTGTFAVTVAGNTRSVSSVAANDTTVTLTLRSPRGGRRGGERDLHRSERGRRRRTPSRTRPATTRRPSPRSSPTTRP